MSTLFMIGADRWAGLSKLIEECGEVQQVAGKLIATQGESAHWDGSDLRERLSDELGDLLAAVEFFVYINELDSLAIEHRLAIKSQMFFDWHEKAKGEKHE